MSLSFQKFPYFSLFEMVEIQGLDLRGKWGLQAEESTEREREKTKKLRVEFLGRLH